MLLVAVEDTVVAELMDRITVDPEQCGGRPCIRGMRIRVTDILDLYAAGLTEEQILEEMPNLEPEDLQAALLYASRVLAEPSSGMEAAILSEQALRKYWLSPEEDDHWSDL